MKRKHGHASVEEHPKGSGKYRVRARIGGFLRTLDSSLSYLDARDVRIAYDLARLEERLLQMFPGIAAPSTGGVYCIHAHGGYVKIGKTNNIAVRLSDIQTHHPRRLTLLAVLSDNPNDEGRFHMALRHHRAMGEWFCISEQLFSVLVDAERKTA